MIGFSQNQVFFSYKGMGKNMAQNTTYVMSTEDKLKVKLLTENLRRVLYTSMILVIGLPVIFLLFLMFPVSEDVKILFNGLFISFELVSIAYFVLATSAIDKRSFKMITFAEYSFWGFVSVFGFTLSYILYMEHSDLTAYYMTLAAITLIAIMPAKDMWIYLSAELVFTIFLIIMQNMPPYQIVGVASANGMFVLLSRVLYKAQASAYAMKQQVQTMTKDAEEDPLTGLLNRRGLERQLNTIWPYCMRNRNLVALIIMDIDNFKKYNDTFGHPQGDKCLQAVAGAIKKSARRSTDIVSRIGGEEFMVFIHGTDEMEPVKLAEKIRVNVEKMQIPQSPALANPYVTISLGVAAVIPDDPEGYSKLYDEADKALYYAKRNGRNCIVYGSHIYGRNPQAKAE